ncbi:glycosyltransferase [Paenibacillus validus]|uniref:Glycosyltransferase n=1 Tax=Paenibacillus validus TaxID=44253 RepID=A0A7X3CW91_9BACL|nr:glycosyltransferase [Paenibacillus validus]MUG73947.1 glycosyltransferase [Paenibacillus validus]
MKIALLNTFDNGGAGKAALRLNKGLNSIGEDSRLFVKWKTIEDENVTQVISPEVNNKFFDKLSMKYFINNTKPGNTISSLMYPSVGFDFLNLFKGYDVINLHWISSFVSVEALMKLNSIQKPLVWTLHDQNPFTGACHYTHGCEKYKVDCDICPQLEKNELNITKYILDAKIKYLPKNITIVTPSKWLAECARESAVFRHNRIEIIANSLETEIYKPQNKSAMKKELGLSDDTKIILFGAEDLSENRKGLHHLLDCTHYLKQNGLFQKLINENKVCVLTFGKPSPILDQMDLPYKALGYIDTDEKIAEIYSVADVLALPSTEDNLPNMMLESLSCGTPVVAFNTGGIKDVIINGYNGYLSEVGDNVNFAENIIKVFSNNEQMIDNSRRYAEEQFALKVQGEKYKELFEELINNKSDSSLFLKTSNVPRVLPEVSVPLMEYVCEVSIEIGNEIKKLEDENIILKQQHIELITNQEQLKVITKERDGILQKLDSLIAERDELIQTKEVLTIERHALKNELNSIITTQDRIKHELEAMLEERGLLKQELDTATDGTARMKQELDAIFLEADSLRQEIRSLTAEREILKQEKDSILLEYNKILKSKSLAITSPFRSTWRTGKKIARFWLPYALVKYYQRRKR